MDISLSYSIVMHDWLSLGQGYGGSASVIKETGLTEGRPTNSGSNKENVHHVRSIKR